MQTIEMVEKIQTIAQTRKQKETRDYRDKFKDVWDWYRQGDIFIMRGPDTLEMYDKTEDRQLVRGDSKGARHMIKGDVEVFKRWEIPTEIKLFDRLSKKLKVDRVKLISVLMNPGIRAKQNWENTHPEHADYLNPAFSFISWSQLDAKTLSRVLD